MAMTYCQAKRRTVKEYASCERTVEPTLSAQEKETQWNNFILAFKEGLSPSEIMASLNCSRTTYYRLVDAVIFEGAVTKEQRTAAVTKHKAEQDLEKKEAVREAEAKTFQSMFEMVENGASYNETGKLFNMTHGQVKWYCEKHGISSSHKSFNDNKKLSEKDIAGIIEKVWHGATITSVANEYGVFPLAVEHHIKKSAIGLEIYPLTQFEESIFSDIGELSTEEIAKKNNTTVQRVRDTCASRGISLRVTGKIWTPLELSIVLKEMSDAHKYERRVDIKRLVELTGRTESAVSIRVSKLRKQYPFLAA